jgi:hypothetical protein
MGYVQLDISALSSVAVVHAQALLRVPLVVELRAVTRRIERPRRERGRKGGGGERGNGDELGEHGVRRRGGNGWV